MHIKAYAKKTICYSYPRRHFWDCIQDGSLDFWSDNVNFGIVWDSRPDHTRSCWDDISLCYSYYISSRLLFCQHFIGYLCSSGSNASHINATRNRSNPGKQMSVIEDEENYIGTNNSAPPLPPARKPKMVIFLLTIWQYRVWQSMFYLQIS